MRSLYFKLLKFSFTKSFVLGSEGQQNSIEFCRRAHNQRLWKGS